MATPSVTPANYKCVHLDSFAVRAIQWTRDGMECYKNVACYFHLLDLSTWSWFQLNSYQILTRIRSTKHSPKGFFNLNLGDMNMHVFWLSRYLRVWIFVQDSPNLVYVIQVWDKKKKWAYSVLTCWMLICQISSIPLVMSIGDGTTTQYDVKYWYQMVQN